MFVVLTMLNGLAVVGLFLACAGMGTALFTQLGLTDTLHFPSAELTLAVGLASAVLLWAGCTLTAAGSAEAE
jgi:hypothetical protein